MTEILDGKKETDLKRAAYLLKQKKLVALPTETVYGLAANGLDAKAVDSIFKAKSRPQDNPLILHVKNLKDAKNLYSNLSKSQINILEKLGAKFWPGPLAIIAPKNCHIPDNVTAKKPNVAVRVPDHEVTLKILSMLDFALAMPSANMSTRPSPTMATHVLNTLDSKIDAVVDGGACEVGIESTVISLLDDKPKILRSGIITPSEISLILGEEIKVLENTKNDSPDCPGLSFLHYAPKVKKVILIEEDELKDIWLSSTSILMTKTQNTKNLIRLGKRKEHSLTLVLDDDAKSFAKSLYGALWDAEKYPEQILAIVKPKNLPEWEAILDRLQRAANYQPANYQKH